MKNQFFGDINDYFKYGLLRALAYKGDVRVGVCWMLTRDEGESQGNRTNYLKEPSRWKKYDPELFEKLHEWVIQDKTRRVDLIEQSSLITSADYFKPSIPETTSGRARYFNEMFKSLADVDLIFFDPDIGLERKGEPFGQHLSEGRLYFSELRQAFEHGHSVLVFQFLPRAKVDSFLEGRIRNIEVCTNASRVLAIRTPFAAFFLALQEAHVGVLIERAKSFSKTWACQFRHGAGGPLIENIFASAKGSIYEARPLKLDSVKTYPLNSRTSKVSVRDFARLPKRGATVREWVSALPRILAGNDFRGVVAALERARARGKPIIWGLGGHVIKVGLGPVLIDLLRRGYLTAAAMNGAALIHDFEIALAGATSEDVPAVLGKGKFGMAEETGKYINEAIKEGDRVGLGLGESAGRFLTSHRGARFTKCSLLATAYRLRAPVTVHEAIGTDIIHNHPAIDPRALGATTHRDFLLLAGLVKQMDGGGVYLNVGSAVMLPEVFLKCVSLVANLSRAPRAITTVNMDFIQHYRPTQNVLLRPTSMGAHGGKNLSHGYALTGHHELMVPLLAAALGPGRLRR